MTQHKHVYMHANAAASMKETSYILRWFYVGNSTMTITTLMLLLTTGRILLYNRKILRAKIFEVDLRQNFS